jgi:hypothetical protein
MEVKYTTLLELTIRQPFYQNGVCAPYTTDPNPDLDLVPTPETLSLMKRLDLLFRNRRQTGGGLILAATNGQLGGNTLLRFAPRKTDTLSFFLLLRNPNMLNFNQLPVIPQPEHYYYFSNQRTGLTRTNLHLSTASGAVQSPADTRKFARTDYRYRHTTPIAPGTLIEVRHLLTGSIVTPLSVQNTTTDSELTFNLAALPSGICELRIGGTLEETVYYVGPVLPGSLFGVIELSLSNTLDAGYRLVEANNTILLPTPLYFIPFATRATTWRYTIKLTPTSPLFLELSKLTVPADKADFINRLKIVSNNPAITFTQTMPDDTTFLFTSDTPLPLKEKYTLLSTGDTLKFTLTKYKDMPLKQATVKDNLPYPDAGLVDARNPAITYSDIFLTI